MLCCDAAFGCAEPERQPGTLFTRKRPDVLTVTCNMSGFEYQLRCSGSDWVGQLYNCSDIGMVYLGCYVSVFFRNLLHRHVAYNITAGKMSSQVSASEMTHIVSGGALNSTHSCTRHHKFYDEQVGC